MAYNPLIGRVLAKKGVEAFAKISTARVALLSRIDSADVFDSFHYSWVTEIANKIARNKREGVQRCTYGQPKNP